MWAFKFTNHKFFIYFSILIFLIFSIKICFPMREYIFIVKRNIFIFKLHSFLHPCSFRTYFTYYFIISFFIRANICPFVYLETSLSVELISYLYISGAEEEFKLFPFSCE